MSDSSFENDVESLLVEAYDAAFGYHPSDKWLDAIAMRTGTKGSVSTLDEAGSAIGVTRERVRQVMAKVAPYLKGSSVQKAQEIAEMIARLSPIAEPIGYQLSKSGMTRPTLTGKGFLNILELIGTSPMNLVGTDFVLKDDWLVEKSKDKVLKALSVAHRHTSAYGMTTVEEIRQALSSADNPLNSTDIHRVLQRESSVKWADDWLWVEKDNDSTHSNRLVNTARSILSVNTPQSVASIHAGARRMWKFRGLDILPPIAAMKVFFENDRHFTMEGDLVHPAEALDYRNFQGTTTATMIDILKGSPYQVMDRQSLHEACADAGIPKGTYGIWTTYAEWMENFGHNVWGLRGSSPNPAAIESIREAARARLKAEPRRKSWAWGSDGRIVQTMDVTTSFLSSGVLSFVPEIQDMIAGQSLVVVFDNKHVAMVKVGGDHAFCWGWHPAIAGVGIEHGNVLRIAVDVVAKRAEIQLGGQELWN